VRAIEISSYSCGTIARLVDPIGMAPAWVLSGSGDYLQNLLSIATIFADAVLCERHHSSTNFGRAQIDRMMNKTLALAISCGLMWAALPVTADPVPRAPVLCLQGKPCEQPAVAPPSAALPPSSDSATTVSGGAIKWHPGHYVWFPVCPFLTTANCYNQATAFIDSIANDPNVKGMMIQTTWNQLEGDTPGDYSKGFAWLDNLLAYMNSHGSKKLILRAVPIYYGVEGRSLLVSFMPKYLIPAVDGGVCAAPCQYGSFAQNQSLGMNLWEPTTMDRWIALVKAYGARYDTNRALETWNYGNETAFAWISDPPNWSYAAYNTQLKRLLDAERAAFPHTNIWHVSNWSDTVGTLRDLVEYYIRPSVYASFGAHDWMPQGDQGWADQIYAGVGVLNGTDFGSTDMRMMVPYFAFQDEPELCDGKTSKPNADALHNWTPQEWYDYGQKTGNADTKNKPLLPTHQLWMAHTGYIPSCSAVGGVSNQTWNGCTTGGTCGAAGSFKDFIDQGTHPTRSTCPTLYPGCNTQ